MSQPKVLTIDIETSPNLAHVWSLWNVNVGLSQLRESARMISFAAKWRGSKKVAFHSDHHDGHEEMVQRAHALLDEADILVHYNGKKFDTPHLRREFLLAGLAPPAPFKEVDLCQVVKSRFRFPSNKLDYVSQALGIGAKVKHEGHELWVACLRGDEKAWARMRRYNKGDVVLTEQLYERLLPWISGHPHVGLLNGTDQPSCQRCGSTDLERRGFAYTDLSKFQQYNCRGCGAWSRGSARVGSVSVRGVQS